VIRQIRRLTRSIERCPGAVAVAVYAEPRDGRLVSVPAATRGYEGVACVDDAARAAILYCRIWHEQRHAWAASAATGLLSFVMYMQDADGLFTNFVLDWKGQINRTGPTSFPGGEWWSARAMHALAVGFATFRTAALAGAFRRGLARLTNPMDDMYARATALSAALTFWQATRDREVRRLCFAWAQEIAMNTRDGILLDTLSVRPARSWGHVQEGTLALVGEAFDDQGLISVASRSAHLRLVPQARMCHVASRVEPHDISSLLFSLHAVHRVVGSSELAEAAKRAQSWFADSNTAGTAVYDAANGLVFDGVDSGHISRNSGAEANIEAALALYDVLPWSRY
jgi:hypothetical protein